MSNQPMKIKVVDRAGAGHVLEAEHGQLMMQVLNRNDLVEATCGGACSCATCQVYVDAAWLAKVPAPSAQEIGLIADLLNTRPGSRLACQIVLTPAMDGIEVVVAPE